MKTFSISYNVESPTSLNFFEINFDASFEEYPDAICLYCVFYFSNYFFLLSIISLEIFFNKQFFLKSLKTSFDFNS